MRRTTTLWLAASLTTCAGLPVSIFAQQTPATAPATPPAQPQPEPEAAKPVESKPAEAKPAEAKPEEVKAPEASAKPAEVAQPVEKPIHLNFKDAPLDRVLDLFARESGVPIIFEAAVPQGTLTFVSAAGYTFTDALSILNLNLQRYGIHLRKQDQYLYLATLQDSMKKPLALSSPAEADHATPDQIVTVPIALDNAKAELVAEQIKGLLGPFGGVVPVPAQNMVVVVESAAQVRRIREIISAIDTVKPVDSKFKIFKLKHANCETVHASLRGLIGERTVTTFIDKDGRKTTTQDVSVAGLTIQPDPRTNSIIAVGSATRIQTCEELIGLLDVPEGGAGGETKMVTISLNAVTSEAAATKVNSLFANVDAKRRPTVIPIPEAEKLTIVGDAELLSQAVSLLSEIDPGTAERPRTAEVRAVTLPLRHITPQTVELVAARLLSPRQQQAVKFAALPSGKGLVVTGSEEDVGAFQKLLAGLDVATDSDRQVRLLKLKGEEPAKVLDAAKSLYAQTGWMEREPLEISLDAESRTATVIGTSAGLAEFDRLMSTAEDASTVELESRRFVLKQADASVLAPKLARLARVMVADLESGEQVDPTFEAIDELRTLLVKARPSQFTVIEKLIEQMDLPGASQREIRVSKLSVADPRAVLNRASELFQKRTEGMAEVGEVVAEFDERTASVVLTGRPQALELFSQTLSQAQELMPPVRTTRIVDVMNATAAEVLPLLQELLKNADSIEPGRKVPDPAITIVERTNSLLVTAEEAQHVLIRDYVQRLDRLDRAELPPLKLLQLRTADASNIATMLTEQYGKRSQADRALKPVDISADAATNTLIVSAHAELFEEIRSFVEDLNRERKTGPQRETKLFQLKVAKATEVASAMDRLYPEPPIPTDRLGRPQPWLKQPKEVSVSAEAGSNSLIFDAPAERMESLEELAAKLDRVELPPAAELKTYRIQGPSLDAVSRTLQAMATRGVLSAPAQPGKQPVQVLIESEPKSSTLIVAGDEKTFTTVEKVLKDLSAVPIEKGLRIFPISTESAGVVRERALKIYEAQVAQIPTANPIEVQVDEKTNSLSVVADADEMARFTKVMDELNRQAGPMREVHLVQLKLAKVNDVIEFLRDLVKSSETMRVRGGVEPEFEAIEATNSLLIAAHSEQFTVIDALVRQLDNSQQSQRPPLRILKLRSTDAGNLATVLQQAFDRRPVEVRSKTPVSIEADAATNTLIVSAHADALPEIEEIVNELNQTQTVDADGREIRIFPLKVARAEELAQTIDQMYPEPPIPLDPRTRQPRPDLKQPREIIVRADRATNSLIVDAPAKRLPGFEEIVRSLDQQQLAENLELRTYRVKRADVETAASTLRSLAANGSLGAGATVAKSISITSEPRTSALVVSGPSEIFTQVESVLKQLDALPELPATTVRMFTLKHARAERLMPLLEKLLTSRLEESEGEAQPMVRRLLDVAADAASNTLIVRGPQDVQKVAEELIQVLDTEAAAAGKNMLRVIPLNFAEAGGVSEALTSALTQIDLPSGGKVSVVPAPGSNALILTGAEKDLAKVENLVAPLDTKPTNAETPAVETFALKHAEASEIAKTVEGLLVQQQQTDPRLLQFQLQLARQGRLDLFKQPLIKVEASTRTNSLIVSAPNATIELAKAVIERLDEPASDPDRIVATFTPLRGDPQSLALTVARVVNQTLPQGRGPVELTREASTGSVVVIGAKDQVAESLKLLAEFDERSAALPAIDLQVVQLKNVEAASIATTVQSLLADRSRWPATLRQVERAGIAVPQPTATADAKSNRLLLSLPSILAPLATQLIASLDQPVANAGIEVQAFRLNSGSATTAAEAIKAALTAGAKPGESAPAVTAEPASNTVVVAASPRAMQTASTLIESMDQAVSPDGIGVRTFPLTHARAEALAPVIETVLTRESIVDKLPMWMRAEAASMEETPVKVAAETRLNAIVVSGPSAVLTVAEQLVAELDVESQGAQEAGSRGIRVVPLYNADAAELAKNLEAVFKEDTTQAPPTIRIDTQSNSLIVRASSSQMTTIDELTRKLDQAALASSRQLKMVPLDKGRVDAAIMAETLRKLLSQQGGVKVEVISTEELLKRGSGEHDDDDPKPSGPSGRAKPSPGGSGDAGGAGPGKPPSPEGDGSHVNAGHWPMHWSQSMLLFVLAQPEPIAPAEPEPPTSEVGEVTIAVDRATNSLVVVGSPRMTDRIALLAAQLEQQLPADPVGVKVVAIPLGVDTAAVADLVRQTVAQIGRHSVQNPGGFTGPVSVFPDPAGNALVVLAGEEDFATVGSLVAAVSRVDSAEVSVKFYQLQNISSDRAAQAIRDLFSSEPRGMQTRRIRALDISMPGPDGPVTARIEPGRIRLTSNPGGTSIIAAAPQAALPLIDRLIEAIDQSPVKDRLSIRRYPLANARADEIFGTLQELFDSQRQGPGAEELPQARFVPDQRTNALLVTASDAQHEDVVRLLKTADASAEEPGMELAIIPLQQASPSVVAKIVEEVVIGNDPAKREKVRVSAEDGSSLFVVRAQKDVIEQVRGVVRQVDTAETSGLPVRSLKLQRADAEEVAESLQQFFAQRAQVSSRPGNRVSNRVAVVGERRTGTLIVAASDDDFAQIQSLVKTFDVQEDTQGFQFKVIPLKNARATEISTTITEVVDEMRWEDNWSNQGGRRNRAYVQTNERTNSVVVMGEGEVISSIEKVIAALDQPAESRTAMVIRSVAVKNADIRAVRDVVERAMSPNNRRSWRGPDPDGVTAEIDTLRRAVILVGKSERVEQAAAYIAQLDAGTTSEQKIEAITLTHARADRAADTLRNFFTNRASLQGVEKSPVTVVGSADGNVIIASADEANLATLKDLAAQIDQPDFGKDRRIEVYVLKNSTTQDTATVLRSMYQKQTRGEEAVVVTPQPSTNSLIVAAPVAIFDELDALVKQLDAPPSAEELNIVPVTLASARAAEVAGALRTALPANIKVTVTPVTRSNSLLLTGSKEAIDLVMAQIQAIDKEPLRSGLVFRKFKLQHTEAFDLSFTLSGLLRSRPKGPSDLETNIEYSDADNSLMVNAPADEIEEIEKMVRELDVPSSIDKTTEFVKLEFANASQTANALKVFYGRLAPEAVTPGARDVTILPDPLSNSLVIRADKEQWTGIRALLDKLDTKEYDTTRQLEVIPLMHAEAGSVARALNEGFRAPLEEQFRQAQARAAGAARAGNRNDPRPVEATVLVDAEGVPSVSAENQTNSLVVFAGGRDMQRIKEVVRQIDVSGFTDMPAARVIALRSGKPTEVASTIRNLYLNGETRAQGPRSVLIIGDDSASALIVRADDERFAQIKALAETLQQQGEIGRVSPHVIRLRHIAAGRLRQTLLATFSQTVKSMGETIAIEIDRQSNSLVVACSPRALEEINKVIAELDVANNSATSSPASPLLAHNVLIVDIQNNAPEAIRKALEDMGVTRAQPENATGIVSEPVTLSVMTSRRALAVVASPADGQAIEALVRALDAEPIEAQQSISVVPLKRAEANALAATLRQMLNPAGADAQQQPGPARALVEHVRRLMLLRNAADQASPVDLSKPVRVLADQQSNSIILASTPGNIEALREVVKTLDNLPVGESVLIRIFTLQNASASRIKTVVDQLFTQGEELRRLPGTNRTGLPPTATGQALAGSVALAVDERTNTLVAAGTEEAVALVEVLLKDLDSDRASNWVEPAIITLKHADAGELAAKLQEVLVRGLTSTPDAAGLQRQYGRLRMLEEGQPLDAKPVQSDLFAPINGMVISADDDLNAVLVIASPGNLAVVKKLVTMLDVPAASASNDVRIFPLKFAAAERVATIARDIFRQRRTTGQIRPEDDIILSADVRTNSLVVATSPKSFGTLETLLKTLDGEEANYSVGLHVVPVEKADVNQLAPRIERLMRERIEAAAQQGAVRSSLDVFSIESDPGNNLLIVACSDENLVVVKELVRALTADANRVAGGERVEVMQLSRVRAGEVSESIQQLYVQRENQRRGPGAVSVTPNERLNALIVSGNEQDMIEIRGLMNRLDKAEVAATQQIKWIELKSANAVEVVNLIENVLAGRPVGGGRGIGARQATRLQFMRDSVRGEIEGTSGKEPTEAEVDGAIRDQVTLTPDPRTNSIWITAPDAMVTIITEMVSDIERSSAGSRKIEYFQLRNSDARQMAELLRDTFNLRQSGNSLVLVPSRAGEEPDPNAPIPEGSLSNSSVTAVPDERQQLSVAIDARTNTLIVSGTEEYLKLVRDLVERLDGIEANERERIVYHLKNAKAKEIETTLQSYFRGDSDRQRSTLGPQLSGSLLRRLEEEVTVVGDEKSNKLVISTSPRYMETVLGIVQELDAAPPQVMIEVLLAEVTIDTDEQWGMDIKAGPFGGDGYTFGTAAGTAGVVTSLGVPNLAVSAADFSLLIRALQAQGKLEVLSKPQVTVNNNQKAEIQVGDEVAIVDGVERNFQGSSFADVVRQQIGIILNVTPSISSDGFVRMEIKPEISQLSAKVQQISSDITAPIINKRAVDTVVTVKDGQSIVIGGLIQTIEEQRRTKVPGLGDVPLIGAAFRSKQNQARKTELLVILTPRVIPGQVETSSATIEEMTKQSVRELQDPSVVEAYLRQVRDQIRRTREAQNGPLNGDSTSPTAEPMPSDDVHGGPGIPPEATRVNPER